VAGEGEHRVVAHVEDHGGGVGDLAVAEDLLGGVLQDRVERVEDAVAVAQRLHEAGVAEAGREAGEVGVGRLARRLGASSPRADPA
jgi:hypothetical protein